jgi:hypothetical protein
MAKKKKPRLSNDQVIATAEGDVQYGPQITQIRDLYTDAAHQRVSDINSAKQSAQSAVAFAHAQRPTVKAVYRRGGQQADRTAADVNAAFGKLGADNPYGAQIAAEQGGARNRINESRIQALQELTERATGAKAGMALAINQARASYRQNKGTLDQKLSDLLGQRGTFIAGRMASLANEQANRRNKIDVANIGADARTNVAKTNAATKAADKAAAQRTKAAAEKTKTNQAAGKATNTFKTTIANAIGDMTRLANTALPRTIPDPNDPSKVIAENKKPLEYGDWGRQQILTEMRKLGYTPQEIAIARKINAKKTISGADVDYIRQQGARVKHLPLDWLDYNTKYALGLVAGPPAPGR